MSQDATGTPSAPAPEAPSHPALSVTFSNDQLPSAASWKHLVTSLSSQQQQQIMDGIGRLHSEESPFPTWFAVGEALSTALLSDPSSVNVQSSMKLDEKDYVLFTRNANSLGSSTSANASGAPGGTKLILEVELLQKLEGGVWQAHWQEARPTMAQFVKMCACTPFQYQLINFKGSGYANLIIALETIEDMDAP